MICEMDQNGVCKRHGWRHEGIFAEIALSDLPHHDLARQLWDMLPMKGAELALPIVRFGKCRHRKQKMGGNKWRCTSPRIEGGKCGVTVHQCTACPVADHPLGAGDRLTIGLSKFGVTKERVKRIIGPCGCDGRQDAINRLGQKVGIDAGIKDKIKGEQSLSPSSQSGLASRPSLASSSLPSLSSQASSAATQSTMTAAQMARVKRWAYGVTTVPDRRQTLLPRTLKSLAAGGFDSPRLFIDGWAYPYEEYKHLEQTVRYPTIKTYGNWILSLAELYIRNPACHLYAIFQDDLVCVKNMREYLNRIAYPSKGYINLYTFPENQRLAPSNQFRGLHLANQRGRGAVALVFSREAVQLLLSAQSMIDKPASTSRPTRAVDGAVVTGMNLKGWGEYVHEPSLVQHIGEKSSMANAKHPLALNFPGERFDAMALLANIRGGT